MSIRRSNVDWKKVVRPVEKRRAVAYLIQKEGMSIRQACRSVYDDRFKTPPINHHIKGLLGALAQAYPTYGFRKMFHHLRLMTKETWNHKRIDRL